MAADLGKGLDADEVRVKLRGHFMAASFEQHPDRWESLWEKGELLPWDRGQPSPALVDALNERKELLPQPRADGRRKKALVPGCGRGYDVLLLASHGYDAIGLDISESAIKECKKFAANEAPKYLDSVENPGTYEFVYGDFFKDDWLDSVGAASSRFDLVYDYTFMCALPTEARPAWSQRSSELLSAGNESRLICLEFPTQKPPATGGPPFGLKPEVYVAHLSQPGRELKYGADGYPDIDTSDDVPRTEGALKRLAHWQPAHSHAVGQGNDWMSIWQHAE